LGAAIDNRRELLIRDDPRVVHLAHGFGMGSFLGGSLGHYFSVSRWLVE
jgi:hypothetical protein